MMVITVLYIVLYYYYYDGNNSAIYIVLYYFNKLNTLLNSDTVVFICDIGTEVFVWIGRGTSPAEKKNAMTYAHVR